MHVPEIIEVKNLLDDLKKRGLVSNWELPYEHLLTRRSAAIFFVTPRDTSAEGLEPLWAELERYPNFSVRGNTEKKLSQMPFRVTFSQEEKEKNTVSQQTINA